MKKMMTAVLAMLVLVLLLTACESKAESKSYRIGISQLVEHTALNDARRGFKDGLKELGVDAEFDYKNAQGEPATAALIAEGFVAENVDLIYAIATPAAQATAQTTSDIPVLFSAVTDPVSAKIVESLEKPGGNVTGTIDAADVAKQLALFKQIDPAIETIGIIYNTSEVNSEVQVDEVKKLAPAAGLKVETVGISSVNDIHTAMETLLPKVDAMYLPSDNLIANSIATVADLMKEAGKISIASEESQVKGGGLLSTGLSYYELGKQTAQMAKNILADGTAPADIPVEAAKIELVTLNKTTAEALGIDMNLPVFADAVIVE